MSGDTVFNNIGIDESLDWPRIRRLIFIGISFLALTGLLIMASVEATKLVVKLVKYCIKEGKKLVTEGSF